MRLWDSPFRTIRTAAVLCWALAIAVFFNAPGNEFAYDDNFIVLENTGIQSLETLPQALLEPYWPGRYGPGLGLWRPVATAVLGAEWALFDGNPVGFHVVNLLLHSGVTVLVVLLLGELLPVAGAFIGGAPFCRPPGPRRGRGQRGGGCRAPLRVLLSLGLPAHPPGSKRACDPAASSSVLLLYGLAFLTKESAITLLGVVLLLDSSKKDLGVRELGSYLARRWVLYGGMLAVAGSAPLWPVSGPGRAWLSPTLPWGPAS